MEMKPNDYNTLREPLQMTEYGRGIQMMVDHCLEIENQDQRQRCAETIVNVMERMTTQDGEPADIQKKLWNHLAAMANYQLEINYPVEIETISGKKEKREKVSYPQQMIHRRHYGAIIEAMTQKLAEVEDKDEQMALTTMIANQMKRSLARWNGDSSNHEKIMEDIASMTDGKVSLLPSEINFLSDNDINSDVQMMSMSQKKKKKKKKR